MDYKNLYFRGHATLQMFKRKIQVEEVVEVLKTGKSIKDYPDDKPYPSLLILGFINNRPLHVVLSTDKRGNCYIITTYEPDLKIWNEDFNRKK